MDTTIVPSAPVGNEVRRCLISLLDQAIALLADEAQPSSTRIHEARKLCKRARGLLRLARPALGWIYQRENKAIRNAARLISEDRDRKVLVETCDALIKTGIDTGDQDSALSVLQFLQEDYESEVEDEDTVNAHMEDCRDKLRECRKRIEKLSFDKASEKALCDGIAHIYKQARQGLEIASHEPNSTNFHDWRKDVKYHRYHLEFLIQLWEPVLSSLRQEAKDLASKLGEEHDLAVLQSSLRSMRKDLDPKGVAALDQAAAQRREILKSESLEQGSKLLAAKPKAIKKQFAALFEAAD
ncbi:MAG: CHAD domain-containing protein [Verrucomicrobiota bacterium JB023]|nr:CHAD domain-containing protein [Verrucomicrobiota bacterium JB023]